MPQLPDKLGPPVSVNGDWINYKCPVCGEGSRNKAPFGINRRTGWCGCFRCGNYSKITDPENLASILPDPKHLPTKRLPEETDPDELLDPPDFTHREFESRGLSALPTIHAYGVRWDGERLCWPTSLGMWRRSFIRGATVKVLAPRGPKGLLGHRRLTHGQHVVICEGDFAAASIPYPWVGVGVGGQFINKHQLTLVEKARPKSVTVFLDAGATPLRTMRSLHLSKLSPKLVSTSDLPERTGPDDIPVADRIRRLLEVT